MLFSFLGQSRAAVFAEKESDVDQPKTIVVVGLGVAGLELSKSNSIQFPVLNYHLFSESTFKIKKI